MQLKLKENPREWQKFTAVIAVLITGLGFIAFRREWIDREIWFSSIAVGLLAVIASLIFPRPFRTFYRLGMTGSFHVGQVMGKVLLTVLFLSVLTPLALVLRIAGKDLLMLRRSRDATTFWRPAKPSSNFDQMF